MCRNVGRVNAAQRSVTRRFPGDIVGLRYANPTYNVALYGVIEKLLLLPVEMTAFEGFARGSVGNHFIRLVPTPNDLLRCHKRFTFLS